MRNFAVLTSVIAGLAGAATIVTVRSTANVYPTEQRRVYERPIYELSKGEVVEVLKWGTPLTKIRNRRGRVGWVEPAKLDSLTRPPILNLVIDSEPPAPVPTGMAKPREEAKNPQAPKVQTGNSLEKPVDFQRDSTHITARSKADSLK